MSEYSFSYNNNTLNIESINYFSKISRRDNDTNNKMRESIIGALINKKIPPDFYENEKWNNLKEEINSYLKNLNEKEYISVECEHKGGRRFKYDFVIRFINEDQTKSEYKVEFKYNISKIEEAPQFVSPTKPSLFMDFSYEEYFYDNYLPQLCNDTNLTIPEKEIYLKNINNNKPLCMIPFQDKYYKGCKSSSKYDGTEENIKFYEKSKDISKKSIREYLKIAKLNKEKMSKYLNESQEDKIYMFYNDEKLIYENSKRKFEIIETENTNNSILCKLPNNQKIKILLRWKNGNGIAFPAFQIS